MTSQNARWAEGMEWTMRYLNKHGLKKGSSFEVRVKYADDVEFKGKVGNKIERKTDLQVLAVAKSRLDIISSAVNQVESAVNQVESAVNQSKDNDLQEQNIIKNIVRLTDFIINKLGFDSLEHKIKQANN